MDGMRGDMNLKKKYAVTFHLTDRCNLRCPGCHWFSSRVRVADETGWEHYIHWVERNHERLSGIKLSGGEPTLYKDFIALVNHLPDDLPLTINTNGTGIQTLREIKRRENLRLKVSENRSVPPSFEKEIQALGLSCSFHSFNGIARKPNLVNELEFGRESDLIGKKGRCLPRFIRFGADGWAYHCEKGLREKNEKLRCGFSLWGGSLNLSGKACEISQECASNFCNENMMFSSSAAFMKWRAQAALSRFPAAARTILRRVAG